MTFRSRTRRRLAVSPDQRPPPNKNFVFGYVPKITLGVERTRSRTRQRLAKSGYFCAIGYKAKVLW